MGNNNSILNKFDCLSVEESAIDQQQQEEMEARLKNRRMCNELLYELCNEIAIVKTSERILLTAHKMYAYLGPRFHKMRLIYGDAIAFLKAKLNAKKHVRFMIDRVVQNNAPIAAINQEPSLGDFNLETNKFCVKIRSSSINYFSKVPFTIWILFGQFGNAHLLYFLRLIAPLLRPIRLIVQYDYSSDIPIDVLVHILNTQNNWIDSIELWDQQFNSKLIYGALSKYNKLQIYGVLSPFNVPRLVQWLTSNNNNNRQSKKYLSLKQKRLEDELISKIEKEFARVTTLFLDEVKKEFARATSKSRFVVRIELDEQLDEFTLCNELTGEKLELRHKNIEDGQFHTHTLSRSPNNGLDDNENDFAQLDTAKGMTKICLCG